MWATQKPTSQSFNRQSWVYCSESQTCGKAFMFSQMVWQNQGSSKLYSTPSVKWWSSKLVVKTCFSMHTLTLHSSLVAAWVPSRPCSPKHRSEIDGAWPWRTCLISAQVQQKMEASLQCCDRECALQSRAAGRSVAFHAPAARVGATVNFRQHSHSQHTVE